MGTLLNPDPENSSKQDLNDSGCVQDATAPENEYKGQAQLLDLSDDVLLYILKYCTPRDLKALGHTCPRLGALICDRTLWTRVDARSSPVGQQRLRWLLTHCLSPATTELKLTGYVNKYSRCLGVQDLHWPVDEQSGCHGGHPAPSPGVDVEHFLLRMWYPHLPRFAVSPRWPDQDEASRKVWHATNPPKPKPSTSGESSTTKNPSNSEPPKDSPASSSQKDEGCSKSGSDPKKSASDCPMKCKGELEEDLYEMFPDYEERLKAECPGPQFTLTAPLLKELKLKCGHLSSLSLEYCNINYKMTNIRQFPANLKKLSLRGTRCFNLPLNTSYLGKIQERLPNLEYLDVSECEWFEPASLMPLSKLADLKELYMRQCKRLTECVAYASLATRYGFRKLKVVDVRGSPLADSEISALGWLPLLEELYCSPPTEFNGGLEHTHSWCDTIASFYELDQWEKEEPDYYRVKSPEPLDNTEEDDVKEETETNDIPERMGDMLLGQPWWSHERRIIVIQPNANRAGDHRLPPRARRDLMPARIIGPLPAEAIDPRLDVIDAHLELIEPLLLPRGRGGVIRVEGRRQRAFRDQLMRAYEDDEMVQVDGVRARGDEARARGDEARAQADEARAEENEARAHRDDPMAQEDDARAQGDEARAQEDDPMDQEGEPRVPPAKRKAPVEDPKAEKEANAGPAEPRAQPDEPKTQKPEPKYPAEEPEDPPAKRRAMADDPKAPEEPQAGPAESKAQPEEPKSQKPKPKDPAEEPEAPPAKRRAMADDPKAPEEPKAGPAEPRAQLDEPKSQKPEPKDPAEEPEDPPAKRRAMADDPKAPEDPEDPKASLAEPKAQPDGPKTQKPEPKDTAEEPEDPPAKRRAMADNPKAPEEPKASPAEPKAQPDEPKTQKPEPKDSAEEPEDPPAKRRAMADNPKAPEEPKASPAEPKAQPHEPKTQKPEPKDPAEQPEAPPAKRRAMADDPKAPEEPKAGPAEPKDPPEEPNIEPGPSKRPSNGDDGNDSSKKQRIEIDFPDFEVLENDMPENDVPENDMPENDVPENDQEAMPGLRRPHVRARLRRRSVNLDQPYVQFRRDEEAMHVDVGLQRQNNIHHHIGSPGAHNLISDSAIMRFGRADNDNINYVHIGRNGVEVGVESGMRPERSNLRILSVTGYRNITDRSLEHLATAAPYLNRIDFSESGVSDRGVEVFKAIRPNCKVVYSSFGSNN